MKKCSKCKQEKTFDGFYKDRRAKDGYNSICKKCRLEMDRFRRENDPEWAEKRKLQNQRFHRENRESIAERKKKWFKTDVGKKSHQESSKKYRRAHPQKRYAHDAVYRALQKGELFRPKFCQICNGEGKIEAHHSSYDNDRRTSVIWICKSCHEKITRS